MTIPIDTIILDIEGTVCPITFVKETLFPYFLNKLPTVLSKLQFPINSMSSDSIIQILSLLPPEERSTPEITFKHFKQLVDDDIKDPILKSLQGHIWEQGYNDGELQAPIYDDSIEFIKQFTQENSNKIYIYSSGSINAQILLFSHVNDNGNSVDLTKYLSGYFDILSAGFKSDPSSYIRILDEINKLDSPKSVLFLSDNVNEVKAAIDAGMQSYIVVRPGNSPLSDDDKSTYKIIHSLSELDL